MMPHFCIDELLMIMAMFPFIGLYFKRLHGWYHHRFHHHKHPRSKPAPKPTREELLTQENIRLRQDNESLVIKANHTEYR